MTTEELAVSRLEGAGPRSQSTARAVACSFCRRRLGDEFYFTCRKCEASYCYIHMSRHQPAPCSRQAGRRHRAQAQSEGIHVRSGGQLLVSGPAPGRSPSANV